MSVKRSPECVQSLSLSAPMSMEATCAGPRRNVPRGISLPMVAELVWVSGAGECQPGTAARTRIRARGHCLLDHPNPTRKLICPDISRVGVYSDQNCLALECQLNKHVRKPDTHTHTHSHTQTHRHPDTLSVFSVHSLP